MRYSSRKFLLATFIVLSATWLVANKHIADGVYSAVVIAVAGLYLGANVTQRYVDKSTAQVTTSV